MIRAVLDTNAVASALISPFGNEAVVLHGVYTGHLTPCYSKEIADEYANVLAREKFSFARNEIQGLLQLFAAKGVLVEPRVNRGVLPDPKDDAFIACAIDSAANFLLTGDERHSPATSYHHSVTKSMSDRGGAIFANVCAGHSKWRATSVNSPGSA